MTKKVICRGCQRPLEVTIVVWASEWQPAGFVHCPHCDEVVDGNERPSHRRIEVSPADVEQVEQTEQIVLYPKRQRRQR